MPMSIELCTDAPYALLFGRAQDLAVKAEVERYLLVVPGVEPARLAKRRVVSQHDLVEPAAAAEVDRLVRFLGRPPRSSG
jgi:hypothetical protein